MYHKKGIYESDTQIAMWNYKGKSFPAGLDFSP